MTSSTGFDIDQSEIPNYIALTGAAAAGRFNGVPGFEEFGKSHRRGLQQLAAAHRRGVRPARRRQGRDPRRLGRLLRLRLHQRQHPLPRPQRAGRLGRDLQHHREHGRHPECRRHASSPSVSRSPTSRARTRSTRTGRSTERSVTPPGIRAAVDEPDFGRLVARALADDGHRRRLRPHRRTRSRRPVGAQHARQRRQRGAMPT